MKPKVCWRPLLLYREVYFVTSSHEYPQKKKRLLIAVCVTAATLVATVTRKFWDYRLKI